MLKVLFDSTIDFISEFKSEKTLNKMELHYMNPSIILNPPYEHIQNMKPNIICINCFNLNELNVNEINVLKYLNIKYNLIITTGKSNLLFKSNKNFVLKSLAFP